MENDDILVQQLFDELLSNCGAICKSEDDYERLKEAFYFARDAHAGVKRKSGEPYITHPIAVARIVVVEIGLGVKSVMASLLHDVVEDTDYTISDIGYRFGDKVASMVDGLTKLNGVFDNDSSEQAENFKRMLLTLSDDVRVIIIKLADRLHNMRTLGSMLPHKQMKIASETIYLFAPLAHRLGLYEIKSELEDLSLKFRFPFEYAEIEEKLEHTRAAREEFVASFQSPIVAKLQSAGIDFHISARVKSVYSIWKKIKRKQVSFDEIYDLFAVRIVFHPSQSLSEKAQCWHIYSLITDIYRPKMDRIRDWIGTPKANGYEALHCTVMGPGGVWAEVQIRSQRMDEVAERGFAAHWKYKTIDGNGDEIDPMLEKLREALGNPSEDAVEFLDNFKMGLQVSEIMVFTPTGESRTMPKGSSALDFAYEIHSKVGSTAIGAKINYKLSSIYEGLSAGDQIEIITSASVVPKVEWLSHVVTAKAKSSISQSLKRETESGMKRGQEIFEDKMRELGVPIQSRVFRKIFPIYNVGNKLEFYSKLGAGIISIDGIEKILRSSAAEKLIKYWSLQISRPFRSTHKHHSAIVENMIIADCCHPIPGDEITGFHRAKGQVEVHKKSCPVAIRLSSQSGENLVSAQWSSQKIMSYLTKIELRGIDRVGILLDLAKIISDELNVNIRSVEFSSHDGIFEGVVSLYVRSGDDLKNIISKVNSVKGIEKVIRSEFSTIN